MSEKANILLVDDQPARLLSYEAILAGLDQNLVRAQSGTEALRHLMEIEFAAILLDVNMPEMDGFETAALIREHPRFEQTPIIFVTGIHVTDLDRLRGYRVGAVDYVYIPVVPEILRGKVQVLVQLYLQRRELMRLNKSLAAANTELALTHERLKAENTLELQKLNSSLELANSQLLSEIKERRRAETQLRESARRKDEFISILAHELRNPLAAIISGVDLMKLPALPAGKLDWARELVERQLRHLVRLIDDLLDVSRMTSGRVRLQQEIVDLRTVVRQSIDASQPLVDERKHELDLHLPDEPMYINADTVRLSQVFCNLLANASKYMEEGGSISISAETGGNPLRALIRVDDKGEGLSPDMLEKVFELFTQANPFRSRAQGGLGIGLALVRGLVELHGGQVRASSAGPGCGCRFEVELPLAESTLSNVEVPVFEERRLDGTSLRVLIVDDNVDAAMSLALHFEACSPHRLRLAHSGNGGVQEAIEFKPDVVLLDIGLPDINGYEVALRLRENAGLQHTGLIAMTGFSGEVDRRRADEVGFDHFMVKPVAFAELEKLLAGWPESVKKDRMRAVS